jgi:hypothetical protein
MVFSQCIFIVIWSLWTVLFRVYKNYAISNTVHKLQIALYVTTWNYVTIRLSNNFVSLWDRKWAQFLSKHIWFKDKAWWWLMWVETCRNNILLICFSNKHIVNLLCWLKFMYLKQDKLALDLYSWRKCKIMS